MYHGVYIEYVLHAFIYAHEHHIYDALVQHRYVCNSIRAVHILHHVARAAHHTIYGLLNVFNAILLLAPRTPSVSKFFQVIRLDFPSFSLFLCFS